VIDLASWRKESKVNDLMIMSEAIATLLRCPGAGVHMAKAKDAGIEPFGLEPEALDLIRRVFRRHPEVREVKIFGSRAMGRFTNPSDVDLALWGDLDQDLIARILGELDELPLPYTFDVKAYESIKHESLKRHIDEIGRILYTVEGSSPSQR
jgi:predicted nucleotidyltransferase